MSWSALKKVYRRTRHHRWTCADALSTRADTPCHVGWLARNMTDTHHGCHLLDEFSVWTTVSSGYKVKNTKEDICSAKDCKLLALGRCLLDGCTAQTVSSGYQDDKSSKKTSVVYIQADSLPLERLAVQRTFDVPLRVGAYVKRYTPYGHESHPSWLDYNQLYRGRWYQKTPMKCIHTHPHAEGILPGVGKQPLGIREWKWTPHTTVNYIIFMITTVHSQTAVMIYNTVQITPLNLTTFTIISWYAHSPDYNVHYYCTVARTRTKHYKSHLSNSTETYMTTTQCTIMTQHLNLPLCTATAEEWSKHQ